MKAYLKETIQKCGADGRVIAIFDNSIPYEIIKRININDWEGSYDGEGYENLIVIADYETGETLSLPEQCFELTSN